MKNPSPTVNYTSHERTAAHPAASVARGASIARRLLFGLAMAFLAALVVQPLAYAQDNAGSIIGVVSNEATKQNLEGVEMHLEGTNRVVYTDNTGRYQFNGIAPGTYTVSAAYTGLDTLTQQATVSAGQPAVVNFTLNSQIYTLETFTIAGEREGQAAAITQQRAADNLKNVVSSDAFGPVTEGNVGEFLKNLPGVSMDYVAADTRAARLRGIDPSLNSVTVDGNRLASSSSSAASRTFEFEQITIQNIDTIEVVKAPTPAMEADSIGGSINLKSKSGFQKQSRQIRYTANLSLNAQDLVFGKTPGPGDTETRKIKPGGTLEYYDQLFDKKLGIYASFNESSQFNEQHRSLINYAYASNSVAGTFDDSQNTYAKRFQFQDGPKTTERTGGSINLDYRVSDNTTLFLYTQYNWYEGEFFNRNWRLDTSKPDATIGYDSTHLTTQAKGGTATFGTSFADKTGGTFAVNGGGRHTFGDWKLNWDGSYSHSTNTYRDLPTYFNSISMALKNLTYSLSGTGVAPTVSYQQLNTTPTTDWTNLDNYSGLTVQRDGRRSTDDFYTAKFSLRKDLNLKYQTYVQVGGLYREQKRYLARPRPKWTFVGPGGLSQFADPVYYQQNPGFDLALPSAWPDPGLMADLFQTHPEYFKTTNAVADAVQQLTSDKHLRERVSAAYVMGVSTINNLTVLGGLRAEKTQMDGRGFSVNNATGVPTPESNSTDYTKIFPNVQLKYDLNAHTVLRASITKSIGRPDFANIISGATIDDTKTTITVANPNVTPQTSLNYDLSAEYYFEPVGVVSAGLFRKRMNDYIDDVSYTVQAGDPQFPDQEGYTVNSKANVGVLHVTGIELNYSQQLSSWARWLTGFGVFANYTYIDLNLDKNDGTSTSDVSGFVPKVANFGLSYQRSPWTASMKFNWKSRYFDNLDSGNQEVRHVESRFTVDLSTTYQIRNNLQIYANARNLFNEPDVITSVFSDRIYRVENFGCQINVGISGQF